METQFLTGFYLPAGYNLKFELTDFGILGSVTFNVTYLVHNNIKVFSQTIDLTYNYNYPLEIYADVNDCKILAVTCYMSADSSNGFNNLLHVYIVKGQGHGANIIVSCIGTKFLYKNSPFSWPFNTENSNNGPFGTVKCEDITVAGNIATYNVPQGYIIRPEAFHINLSTDANVASRYVKILIEDNCQKIYENFTTAITAGLNRHIYFVLLIPKNAGFDWLICPFPELTLGYGCSITVFGDSLQAGDLFAGASIHYTYFYN